MGSTHKPFRHCLQSTSSSTVGYYAYEDEVYRSERVSLPLSRDEVNIRDR
ncbi:MAG: hypothetical protein IJT70_03775 [Clostridia bacterium]|nr:hypothetical protein [Clostridia bacterium]